MVHLTELKFGMYIIVIVKRTLLILGNIRCIVFFTGVQKIFFAHYGLCSQIIVSVQVSKPCILLDSNLVCVVVLYIVLILVNLGLIVFFTEVEKRILIHY